MLAAEGPKGASQVTSGVPLKPSGEGAETSSQMTNGESADAALWLRCRAGNHHFALPMGDIIETMRMLPIETIAGAPAIVRGLCIVRGVPIAVVDTALFFGERSTEYERIVTARVADRTIGFAVDAVIDVRSISAAAVESLPPLFGEVEAISAMAMLDDDLVFFLHAARAVPDDFFASLDDREAKA